MSAPKLRDIGQVVEVGGAPSANEYLALGWLLIATFARGDRAHGRTLWYALGWPRSAGPPAHPTHQALHLSVVDADALYPPEDERLI